MLCPFFRRHFVPGHGRSRRNHQDLLLLLPLMTIGHEAGHYCHFKRLRSFNTDTGRKKKKERKKERRRRKKKKKKKRKKKKKKRRKKEERVLEFTVRNFGPSSRPNSNRSPRFSVDMYARTGPQVQDYAVCYENFARTPCPSCTSTKRLVFFVPEEGFPFFHCHCVIFIRHGNKTFLLSKWQQRKT